MCEVLSRAEISQRVKGIIAEQLRCELCELPDEATIRHLAAEHGFDSLDAVEIVMAVEEEFSIDLDFTPGALEREDDTVGEFVDLVRAQAAA